MINYSPSTLTTEEINARIRWTVMVFMGAEPVSGTASLEDAADADIAEMESVESAGLDDHLSVFVQLHSRGRVQRGRIGDGPLQDVPFDPQDAVGGRALGAFIQSSLDAARHDQADPYHYCMLVLWGHAFDFAFGPVETSGGVVDALDFAELSEVLLGLQKQLGGPEAKLNLVGFDACDLATVEVACQLAPFADYLLGSQVGIPIPGWPYDRILDRLKVPQGRRMGPAEFGSYVVRRYCESYKSSSPVSLSLLDLTRVPDLFAQADVFAQLLTSAIADPDTRDWIAALFVRSQTGEGRPYVDVVDFCLSLMREGGDAIVAEAARALGDFLVSPQLPLTTLSLDGIGRPFVIEHGRNATDTARLNGISIYAPHVAPSYDFDAAQDRYLNFVFARKTLWSRLVHTLARSS